MPVNNNLLARIRIINDCLGNSYRKYWSREALIEKIWERAELNVSPRTLDGDIAKMRGSKLNYNAPIDFCRINGGYYYTQKGFSIDNLPLTDKDIQTLEFATTALSQFKDITLFAEFSNTVDRLIGMVNQIKYTNHPATLSFIDFEKVPFAKGLEHLDTLVRSIKDRDVLSITYQRFDRTAAKKHTIHPYILKQYKNRWYLIGLSKEKSDIITLCLDRISEIGKVNKEEYIDNKSFNVESYFEHTIGINYEDGRPMKVVLSFTPSQGHYVKTQFLHKSQKVIKDNAKEYRIELFVVPNYELVSTILSHCDQVKVISPDSLKTQIAGIVGKCNQLYSTK